MLSLRIVEGIAIKKVSSTASILQSIGIPFKSSKSPIVLKSYKILKSLTFPFSKG